MRLDSAVKLPKLKSQGDVFASASIADSWIQIVGVVANPRNEGLREPERPAIFVPYTLSMPPGTVFLVRSEVPPMGEMLPAIRRAIARVNSDQITACVVNDLSITGSASRRSRCKNISSRGCWRRLRYWR